MRNSSWQWKSNLPLHYMPPLMHHLHHLHHQTYATELVQEEACQKQHLTLLHFNFNKLPVAILLLQFNSVESYITTPTMFFTGCDLIQNDMPSLLSHITKWVRRYIGTRKLPLQILHLSPCTHLSLETQLPFKAPSDSQVVNWTIKSSE